ncbi:MAG TPA: hypothetical protein ENK43_16615 [Planctomycetes bacterium]|nr:hypothetical protein [Planctomycetota bacterium]
MARVLCIPDLGGVDRKVKFRAWHASPGDPLTPGQVLAVVETSKAAFEIEVEAPGVLMKRLAEEDDDIPMGAPYALVGAEGETLSDEAIAALIAAAAPTETDAPAVVPEAPPAEEAAPSPTAAVPAARRKARAAGIPLESIRPSGPRGEITLQDVVRHLSGASASRAPSDADGGRVDATFLDLIRADRSAFAALSSAMKVHLYRLHGADLGENVQFGPGSLILAGTIRLGDGVTLRDDVVVECESIEARAMTYFGPRSSVRCRTALFHENVFMVRDVEIGGGGHRDPTSSLEIGAHGFIGENVHLNPCRGIRIGEEVTISRNVTVMTHSFAQSTLEGFPTAFAPVKIGARSQIGINCVLFPGVHIGEGAVVLSGSSVVTDVGAGRLAGGVPAIDLKAARRELSKETRRELARQIILDFATLLRAHGRGVEVKEAGQGIVLEVEAGASPALLVYGETPTDITPPVAGHEVCLVTLEGSPPENGGAVRIALLQKTIRGKAGPLAESFREFLRKRGIRLEPRTWTYRGGWI